MELIKNNPFRKLGLLADASTREISRQTNRLQKIIAAEQEPSTDDYSFPVLGSLTRTIESIEDANSKLNLDNDKVNAALFWFWNGNPITDEVAFDALKDGNTEKAYQIWDKLITETKEDGKRFWRAVTEKNCSAFHNCFVLEMLRPNGNKHNAIVANLYFLESDFSQKLISTIADSTHKTNSKELQTNFLNDVLLETGKRNSNFTLSKFVSILNSIDFTAKTDFLKSISRKFVNNISVLIETAKKKRTASKVNAANAGEELIQQSKNDLEQLKSIVGVQDFTYSNIADKVANEVLQCSIDFFNYNQNIDADNYHNTAIKLAKLAEGIAIGRVTKERIKDSINTLEEMKDKEILQAIELLKSVKDAFEQACRQIDSQVFQQSMNLGYGQTINWSKVEELKRNALDWNKVVKIIKETISLQNIEKIKNAPNQTKIDEYKNLTNFLIGKLPYSKTREIKYLAFWTTTGYNWYNNPRNWENFGGWWWMNTNTGDAQLNGCLGILLLPFNLAFGIIYILYRAVAGILAEINRK